MSHRLRHSNNAILFIRDLSIDFNVFLSFYSYAKRNLFLESLNFVLKIEEYRSLPVGRRVILEHKIMSEYLAPEAPQLLNIEAEVHSNVMERVRNNYGAAQTLDEVQLASAAIIAADPWRRYLSTEDYRQASSQKAAKAKNFSSNLSEVVDPDVFTAALGLFRHNPSPTSTGKPPNKLQKLKTWLLDPSTPDPAFTSVYSLRLDFDSEFVRSWYRLLLGRPRALQEYYRVLAREFLVASRWEREPFIKQRFDHLIPEVTVRTLCTCMNHEWALRHFSKMFKSAFKEVFGAEASKIQIAAEASKSLYTLAFGLLDLVIEKFHSLPKPFLLFLAIVLQEDLPRSPSTSQLEESLSHGVFVLVSWLCDVVSSPIYLESNTHIHGISARKQIDIVCHLILRATDVREVGNTRDSPETIESLDTNDKDSKLSLCRPRLIAKLTPLLDADYISSLRIDSVFPTDDTVRRVAEHLIAVGDRLIPHLASTPRGVPGYLYRFLSSNAVPLMTSGAAPYLSEEGLHSMIKSKNSGRYPLSKSPRGRVSSIPVKSRSLLIAQGVVGSDVVSAFDSESSDDHDSTGEPPTIQVVLNDALSSIREKEQVESNHHTASMKDINGGIVIVGGGLSGLLVAQGLAQKFKGKKLSVPVVLVSKHSHFVLKQSILDALFEQGKVSVSRAYHANRKKFTSIFSDGSVTFIQEEVKMVTSTKVVMKNLTIAYSSLVLASGYSYRSPLPAKYCASLDFHTSRDDVEEDENILIIGGGVKGVELAADLATHFAVKKRVTLVSRDLRLLPKVNAEADQWIHDWLRKHGVTVELGEDIIMDGESGKGARRRRSGLNSQTSNQRSGRRVSRKGRSVSATGRSHKLDVPRFSTPLPAGGSGRSPSLSPRSPSLLKFSMSSKNAEESVDSKSSISESLASDDTATERFFLKYSGRPVLVDKAYCVVPTPNTHFLATHFLDYLSSDSHVRVNQYMQISSPATKRVVANVYALGEIVKFAGIGDDKYHHFPKVRQAGYVVDHIIARLLSETVKAYKPLEFEKRATVRMGKKEAIMIGYGEFLDSGSNALHVRRQMLQHINKEIFPSIRKDKEKEVKTREGGSKHRAKGDERNASAPRTIAVMALTMNGRETALQLLHAGHRIRVILDTRSRRSLFEKFEVSEQAEIVMIDWNSPATLTDCINGIEVLLYNTDNGPPMLTQWQSFRPILVKSQSLKFVVQAATAQYLTGLPQFESLACVQPTLVLERELLDLASSSNFSVVCCRTCVSWEMIFYWFGDDIKTYRSCMLARGFHEAFMALEDVGECLMNIILSPASFLEQKIITINTREGFMSGPMLLEVTSQALGWTLHHVVVDRKEDYIQLLSRDGMSGVFANMLAEQFYDANFDPELYVSQNYPTQILQREPLSLMEWVQQNLHFFGVQ